MIGRNKGVEHHAAKRGEVHRWRQADESGGGSEI